ncbi:DNA helicase [Bacillus sp. M6-12]|uniref:AAA domain-containing protein n=1 Tax=Bacillus sp. M6-12 TaxID=2054166 RepID=UPI000C765A98|nr:AAA domain-containing protein [Bacillus sp. M6-12]PLS18280.1 DNA helicase [Bacillus sp. M6-12]
MTTTIGLIKEWQKALQIEIQYIKKYGSTKYRIKNGHLLSAEGSYNYYFETSSSIKIPLGSSIRLEWGSMMADGRILSSEGNSVILALTQSLGDLISDAHILFDPWELLEQLILRLDEAGKSKNKRVRIKKLIDPSMPAKQPDSRGKTKLQQLFARAKYNPVTYVWGPPGTGKTHTLARVAANKYLKGERVLIVSHSNQAVDVLAQETSAFLTKKKKFVEGEILRYGSQSGEILSGLERLTTTQLIGKHHPQLAEERQQLFEEKRLLKQDIGRSFSKRDTDQLIDLETKISRVLEKIRYKEIQFLKEAKIVATTLAKAATDEAIYANEFNLVIVDEASMAYVPQIAFAASLAKRIIVCGDFKQLPPIAAARHELVTKWLKEDIFHRAGVVNEQQGSQLHPHLFLLDEQRRMHPEISAFTNRHIYHGLVADHETVFTSRQDIAGRAPFPDRASMLVDTAFTGENCLTEKSSGSRINPSHLMLSFQLIHEAYVGGSRSIGYATPYRAQAELMEILLKDLYSKERETADILAATVHRFQGSEREVMIFDGVDSYPHERAGMLLTGPGSERLINVAITRTKGKFIHVADSEFSKDKIYRSKTLHKLITHQSNLGQTADIGQIGAWIKNQHHRLQWMHARKLERAAQDIAEARESIVLSLPNAKLLPEIWIKMLSSKSSNAKLTVLSEASIHGIAPDKWIQESFSLPFMIIDGRLFWLGIPVECAKRVQPPYVASRLDSMAVSEYFLAQLPAGVLL